MRWIVLALALVAGCGDDDSAPDDAGRSDAAPPCWIVVDDPELGPLCVGCARAQPDGTCLWRVGTDEIHVDCVPRSSCP